ncbi:MAG: hypothetical protein WC140_00175 [Bacteroidales bacterium]
MERTRREISKNRRTNIKLLVLFLCVYTFTHGFSQKGYSQQNNRVQIEFDDNAILLHKLELLAEEGGNNLEEIFQYYEFLKEDPLDVNTVTENELESLLVLNIFQIMSLLEYRNDCGDILSYKELELVDGFNPDIVKMLNPYLKIKTKNISKIRNHYTKQKITIKLKEKIKQKNEENDERTTTKEFYGYSSYRMFSTRGVGCGFTYKGTDYTSTKFLSGYFQLKDLRIKDLKHNDTGIKLKSFIVGDYRLRWGQGLLTWNSFNFKDPTSPTSMYLPEYSPMPYTSTIQDDLYRGICLSLEKNNFKLTAAYSNNLEDGRLSEYSKLADKEPFKNSYYANLSWMKKHFKIGLNGIYQTGTSLQIGTNLQTSTKQQINMQLYPEKPQASVVTYLRTTNSYFKYSTDISYVTAKYRVFGEFAMDKKVNIYSILGTTLSMGENWETGMRFQYQNVKVLSRSDRSKNIRLLCTNLLWHPEYYTKLSFYSEIKRNPKGNYFYDWNLLKIRNRIDFSREFETGELSSWFRGPITHSLKARILYDWKNYSCRNTLKMRGGYSFICNNGLQFATKVESSIIKQRIDSEYIPGIAAYLETAYYHNKIKALCRFTAFNIKEWDGRLYFYERGLVEFFSIPAIRGRGFSFYSFFGLKLFRKMNISIKYAYSRETHVIKYEKTKFSTHYFFFILSLFPG